MGTNSPIVANGMTLHGAPGSDWIVRPIPPLSERQRGWIEAAERHVDEASLADLISQIVGTPSPTGNEHELATILVDVLADAGVESTLQPLDAMQANALGVLPGEGTGPKLLMYAPIDTHTTGDPAKDLPWVGEALRDDMVPVATPVGSSIVGLGAGNPKGHAACVVAAARALARAGIPFTGDVVVGLGAGGMPVTAPADDPLGRSTIGHGRGCDYMVSKLEGLDSAIIAKPGSPSWEEVGLAIIRIDVPGEMDYAGSRHRGTHENPILNAAPIIDSLEKWCREYTHRHTAGTVAPQGSIGALRAGWPEKPTFTPARCEIYLDLRIAPGGKVSGILAEFESGMQTIRENARNAAVDWEVLAAIPGGRTRPASWIVQSCVRAWETIEGSRYEPPTGKSGATDAAILRGHRIPTVRVGMPPPSAVERSADFSSGMNTVELDAAVRLTRTLIRCAVDTCTRTRDEIAQGGGNCGASIDATMDPE
ncbi:MAG: deacylase [Dehalococcoidia bacterium]